MLEIPVNKGIVMYCGIADPEELMCIPNSRCNCSSVNIIPFGVPFLLKLSAESV